MGIATVNVKNETGISLWVGVFGQSGLSPETQVVPPDGQNHAITIANASPKVIGFWNSSNGDYYKFTEGLNAGKPAATGGDVVGGGTYSVVVSRGDCTFN